MSDEAFQVSVSNESEYLFPVDFDNIFAEGYSKKGDNRGYGLPNLARDVKKVDGELNVQIKYNEEHECNFLNITINVQTYDKKRLFKD